MGKGVELLELRVSDKDEEIIECHHFSSLCNQAFVSFNFIDRCFGKKARYDDCWAVFNAGIVLRVEPCNLVAEDTVVLDSNQRRCLGDIRRRDMVYLNPWIPPLGGIKCSEIWVSITLPPSLSSHVKSRPNPPNIAKFEQIIRAKFLGHVMTEGQIMFLDRSWEIWRQAEIFDIKVTDIIGGKSSQGKFTRGILDTNTVIRAFADDDKDDRTSVFTAIKDRCVTLETLMDKLDNILIIGTTRRIDRMWPGALRPGRFELHVKLDLPNNSGRQNILKAFIRPLIQKKYIDENVIDLQEIALWTNGDTAVALRILVQVAAHNAMKRGTQSADLYAFLDTVSNGTKIDMDDFYVALGKRTIKITLPDVPSLLSVWNSNWNREKWREMRARQLDYLLS